MKIKNIKDEIVIISNVIKKFSEVNLDISRLSGKQLTLFKEIKPDELQSYISSIQEIKNATNTTGSPLFDSLQIEKYAQAIDGLEDKQAALLLSTQGLSNAQIQQTL